MQENNSITEKRYMLVIGNPEPLNKERVTLWLRVEGATVALLSQRIGCAEITELRFFPDGNVVQNKGSHDTNFRWGT